VQNSIAEDRRLRDAEDIVLYSTGGRVIAPRAFAASHLDLLDPLESALVAAELAAFSEDGAGFDRPLLRTELHADGELRVPARRGANRSAYLPERQIKIKACRPEDRMFPHWELDDGFALKVEEIPFGVLSAEGVMRELLASCFERRHGLPSTGRPLAIFEYAPAGNGVLGYALVSHVPGDERVERFLDCDGLTLHGLILRKRSGRLESGEAKLRGLCRQAFVEAKADLLTAYNFGGGFRGLLNSNIGNDVIRGGALHSICDFDTFRCLPVPAASDREGIRRFTMSAFIELIKSSLPFIDYLDVDGRPREEIHGILARYYRDHSTLFHAYAQRFRIRASGLGWHPGLVDASVIEAHATRISFELLQELIPNSHTARGVQPTTLYIPHNG
jgi:hypothetical protein